MEGAIPMNGKCPKHGCIRITEDGVPVCLVCMKEEALAKAVPVGVVTVEDPGEAAALAWGKSSAGGIKEAVAPPQAPSKALPVVAGLTFDEHILKAVEFLQKAPMPGNMAQFKLVASAVKSLQKAVTPKQEI